MSRDWPLNRLHSTVERVAAFAGVSQEQLTHALLREEDIHVDGR